MSKDDVDIRVRLREARKAQQDADRVRKGLLGVGSASKHAGLMSSASSRGFRLGAAGLLGVGSAAGAAGAALVGMAYVLGKKSVDAFTESEKVAKDQAVALKSTGAQAWITSGHLDAMAQSQRRKTGIDDEAIAKSQTLLLTFRQIHNEVGAGNKIFDQATQVTLDLSKRFGKDLSSSSILVGKALNDPLKGLTALQRVGITFTAQQKDQIKTLVASGDTLAAQKVILAELTAQTKGSAAAQATNADRLRSSWDNVKEAIGSGLYPTVTKVEGALFHLSEHAQPYVAKAAKDISTELGKGLTLDHLKTALKLGRGDLRPLTDELKREFRGLHLGPEIKSWHIDKHVEDAFVAAAPRIADAMARAAPKAAMAFAHAFANAGPGGQLITVALLASKLGAFRAVGPILARTVAARFGTALPGEVAKKDAGKGAGAQAAKGQSGFAIGFGKALGALSGYIMLHELAMSMPDLAQYSGKKGWGELKHDLLSDVGIETRANPQLTGGDAGALIPGNNGSPLTKRPQTSKSKRKTTPSHSNNAGGSHAHTARSRGMIGLVADQPIVLTLDGRTLAESSAKVRLVRRNRGGE